MLFEVRNAWRTIRNEGIGALGTKIGIYSRHVLGALSYWRALRAQPAELERVVDFTFTVAHGLIMPGQIRSEIVALGAIVRKRQPRIIVEIGTARGGTLFIWCALAHPEATLVSIDLPGGMHGGGYPYWKTFVYKRFPTPKQKLHLLRGDSHSASMLEQLKMRLAGQPIDFLFIDGDHTYAGVKRDFEMYSSLVRKGGLIAFHDIAIHPPEIDCHVDKFWNELKQTRPSREFIENPKQGWGGIGLIEV